MKQILEWGLNQWQFFSHAGNTYAGISIKGYDIHLSVVKIGWHNMFIREKIVCDWPITPEAASEKIHDFFREHSFKPEGMVLSIAARYFPVTIPIMQVEEIGPFLKANTSLFIPAGISADDYLWDHMVYDIDQNDIHLSVALLKRQTVTGYIDTFSAQNLPLLNITTDNSELDLTGNFVFEEHLAGYATLTMVKNGVPFQSVPITESGSKNHSMVLDRSWKQFYANFPEIKEFNPTFILSDRLAALAGMKRHEQRITFSNNFANSRFELKLRKQQVQRVLLALGGLTVLLLLILNILFSVYSSKLQILEDRNTVLSSKIIEVDKLQQTVQTRHNELAKIVNLLKNRSNVSGLIETFSRHIPDYIWFHTVNWKETDKGQSVQITGFSKYQAIIPSFMDNLEALFPSSDIRLLYARKVDKRKAYRKWKLSTHGFYEFKVNIAWSDERMVQK